MVLAVELHRLSNGSAALTSWNAVESYWETVKGSNSDRIAKSLSVVPNIQPWRGAGCAEAFAPVLR